MNPSTSPRPPSFRWQAALILLPVIVLAAVGFVSLRQDRLLAEQEARERAAELVQRVATDSGETLSAEIAAFLRLASGWYRAQLALAGIPGATNGPADARPGASAAERVAAGATNHPAFDPIAFALPAAVLSETGPLLSPPDYPNPPQPPDWLAKLTAGQMIDWQTLRLASDAAIVEAALVRLRGSNLPPAASAALERDALHWTSRTNSPAAQAQLLDEFLDGVAPEGLSESGLPVWDIVALQLLQLSATNSWPQTLARGLPLRIQSHPSLLTGALLEQAARTAGDVDKQRTAALRAIWRAQETARQLAHRIGETHRADAGKAGALWVSLDSTNWLALVEAPAASDVRSSDPAGELAATQAITVRFVPELVVVEALRRARTRFGYDVPAFSRMSAGIAGRQFSLAGESVPAGAGVTLLAEAGSWIETGRDRFPLRITSVLENPDLLYSRQRQRVQLFGALIGVSAVAAMIGLFTAWRAFRRQLHLAEMKSNFVSSVSHELRAPIASVRLLAEGLERGTVNDAARQREYHGLIVRECRRLSALIENVLDFARIEQGRKQYEFEPTDAGRLLHETVKLVEPLARERGVTISLLDAGCRMSDGEALTANWDGRAIQQALLNLLDNALKHAPPGSEITVLSTLNPRLSSLILSVTDSGPGIPREDHARIFERFYRRGSELRRETQGVGLGLAIVKHIAEAHGGRVRVESEPGKGAKFILELPVASPRPETNQK